MYSTVLQLCYQQVCSFLSTWASSPYLYSVTQRFWTINHWLLLQSTNINYLLISRQMKMIQSSLHRMNLNNMKSNSFEYYLLLEILIGIDQQLTLTAGTSAIDSSNILVSSFPDNYLEKIMFHFPISLIQSLSQPASEAKVIIEIDSEQSTSEEGAFPSMNKLHQLWKSIIHSSLHLLSQSHSNIDSTLTKSSERRENTLPCWNYHQEALALCCIGCFSYAHSPAYYHDQQQDNNMNNQTLSTMAPLWKQVEQEIYQNRTLSTALIQSVRTITAQYELYAKSVPSTTSVADNLSMSSEYMYMIKQQDKIQVWNHLLSVYFQIFSGYRSYLNSRIVGLFAECLSRMILCLQTFIHCYRNLEKQIFLQEEQEQSLTITYLHIQLVQMKELIQSFLELILLVIEVILFAHPTLSLEIIKVKKKFSFIDLTISFLNWNDFRK
jgi:hypothetical protein